MSLKTPDPRGKGALSLGRIDAETFAEQPAGSSVQDQPLQFSSALRWGRALCAC